MSMAELRHCIQNESVHHLSDFVVQRTGRLYFDIGSIPGILDTLAETMGSILGWDEKQIIKEKETVKELIIQATDF
jgi:glycerol-3-phosphate dehydrogenase